MSRNSCLRCVQMLAFLAIVIACNVVVVGDYPESDSICVSHEGAACTDIGDGICFLQGGGFCHHCKGGQTLPETYCTIVAGGQGCEGGGAFYCGLQEVGDCVDGECVNLEPLPDDPCDNVQMNCT